MPRTAFKLLLLYLFVAGFGISAHAEKRVALVIGNAAYSHAAPLKNPKNDAEAISGKLEVLGFEVVKGTDLTYSGMRKTLRDYVYKLEGADVALLFYAGHGLQVNGRNYLAPVDAQLNKELDLEFEAMRLETVLSHMEQAAKTNLVFIDACRDNPLARNLARSMGTRSASIGRGLARVETGVGTLIAFATQPGNVAYDGDGTNSPFATGLLKHIETPGLDVALVMRRVRQDVIEATKGAQVPWDNSSLTQPFVFKAKAAEEPRPVAAPPPVMVTPQPPALDKSIELAFWQSANEQKTREAYEVYLERFPKGEFAPLASLQIDRLKRDAARETHQASSAEAERKKQDALRAAEAEAAKKKTEDERLKQIAEHERLAKERVELEKRLAEYEARLKAEAETKAKDNAARTQVAAVEPAASTSPAPESAITDPRILTLVLQAELKRVGCDPGEVDGNWGQQGKSALQQFTQHAKVKFAALEPSQEAIDALKDKTTRVCPLVCSQLEVIHGDQCVPKSCGVGQTLTRNGTCIAIVARQPRPPSKKTVPEYKECKFNPLTGGRGGC